MSKRKPMPDTQTYLSDIIGSAGLLTEEAEEILDKLSGGKNVIDPDAFEKKIDDIASTVFRAYFDLQNIAEKV